MSHPVTGSGAAQSLRPISALEAQVRQGLLVDGAQGDVRSPCSAFGPLLRNVLIGFAAQSERATGHLQGGCSSC